MDQIDKKRLFAESLVIILYSSILHYDFHYTNIGSALNQHVRGDAFPAINVGNDVTKPACSGLLLQPRDI